MRRSLLYARSMLLVVGLGLIVASLLGEPSPDVVTGLVLLGHLYGMGVAGASLTLRPTPVTGATIVIVLAFLASLSLRLLG